MKTILTAALLLAVAVAPAAAQTATQPSNEGAFDKLSPGNQKIAQALYDAQVKPSGTTGTTSNGTKTLTLDEIAAMKQQDGGGWGNIFKTMKADGQIPSDVKNLGQLVSGKYQSTSRSPAGTTITTASGRSHVVGGSGKGHMAKGSPGDDGATGGKGGSYRDNSGKGSLSSGSGHGYGRGNSGPSASAGRGSSGSGSGKGK